MTRKLLFVVLSLALLAGGIAFGIHLLHKDALAMQTYTCKVVFWDGDSFEGVEGVTVDFWWDEDGVGEYDWVAQDVSDENGYAQFQHGWENPGEQWGYVIQLEEWFEFVNPPDGQDDGFGVLELWQLAIIDPEE